MSSAASRMHRQHDAVLLAEAGEREEAAMAAWRAGVRPFAIAAVDVES